MRGVGAVVNAVFLSCILPSTTSASFANAADRADTTLWYRQPGQKWLDAMPLGNGRMGAMVFGGIQRERIALNESSFWSGRPHDYDDPRAGPYYPRLRDLMLAGRFQEAQTLADAHFLGIPAAQQAFQPLGNLVLSFNGAAGATDYLRELDLRTGIATVRYRVGDAIFRREIFVSWPDRVMVIRLTCNRPGRISVQARFNSPYLSRVTTGSKRLAMDGVWKGPIPVENGLIAPVSGTGMRFQAVIVADATGGTVTTDAGSLRVGDADAVTFLQTDATSFVNWHDISGDPAAICASVLKAAEKRDFATLRRRNTADFSALMDRVHLHVGDPSRNDIPTDERLAAYRAGRRDTSLEALVFQFGRYLLVSSSRAGGRPANLQGIWDESISPTWGSKYTLNANFEMNYQPAEVCNLAECETPLFDLLRDISVSGAKTAKTYYGISPGWVAHHNVDLWCGTAPVDQSRYGLWPVGGAWLCQFIQERYAFSGDRAFLRAWYPIMKGSAEFLLSLLVEEPKHHWLVTPVSMSPEHGYFDAAGRPAVLTSGPTMDIAILRELFPHCIRASRLLNVDPEFRERLKSALKRLPPYQINSAGYLQEWIEDWKPMRGGRDISPNFAIFPGSSITLRGTPELAAAIRRKLTDRPIHAGYITCWNLCVQARLELSDQVSGSIQTYIRTQVETNLHNRAANQSDASFGYTAGVAESLLQSQAGEINLLPALPTGWIDGDVEGLRARGGLTIDLRWKAGRLESAVLHRDAVGDGPTRFRIRNGERVRDVTIERGQSVRVSADLRAVPLSQ